ncbi:coat protein [ssRNA phage SRR5467090_9]|uniref:Coat protein n=1 Tax=ssRNA phage SRR5467090_9 TaxID=2786458 RepID=A0A8S5L0A7_9VIRU|nr:coat protein [ssRNA phage SRR5467090_9]DAD50875.1 TPA_asm: coat protein [ssRNA phage SRR5467090_9]
MFSDPLVADVNVTSGGAVTKPFTTINYGTRSTDRVYIAAAAGDPRQLKISHEVVGKGSAARDRHLVSLVAYGVVGGVEVPSTKATVYLVADIPQSGITAAQKTAMFHQFVGLIRGGSGNVAYDGLPADFWDRFLNGEA